MQIPENAKTANAEGKDLFTAIRTAAEELGVDADKVAYKLDLSHFRSTVGGSRPRDTVRIIAWESDDAPVVAKKAAGKHPATSGGSRSSSGGGGRDRDRRSNKRDDRRSRSKGKPSDTPEEGTTEASDFSEKWFQELLGHMGVKGTVEGTGSDERIHLRVRADQAGRIIGRRGSTLGAIRHLLGLALEDMGSPTIDVDVDDDREKSSGGKSSRRDDRRDDRKGGGRRRRGKGGGGEHDEDKLRQLARRAAEKAIDTGKTITINLELNSYDRRIVHVEISEMDDVSSHSEEKDGTKYVQVVPD